MHTKLGSALHPCPPKITHLALEIISGHLVDIFNQMIKLGHFPNDWKVASILPLLKKTNLDPADPNNYWLRRPPLLRIIAI